MIVGTALAMMEATWLLHEQGWSRAVSNPRFYEELGGGVGAIALGLAGGSVATVLACKTGPLAPVIGVAGGAITGTIGYVGGREITHTLIDMIDPEMLQKQERERLHAVRASISGSIARAKKLPTP
jgi:hypothetical protein